MIQAIEQARCVECENDENEFDVTRREYVVPESGDEGAEQHSGHEVLREVVCDCGETATVRITEDGVDASGVSYEDASWTENTDDSEEESE